MRADLITQVLKDSADEINRLREINADLLAACEAANDAIGAYMYEGEFKGNWSFVLDKVREAIAKAKGGA